MMITKVDNNDYDNHNGLTPNPSGAPPRRRLPSQGHCLFPLIALIADICVDHIVNYFKKKKPAPLVTWASITSFRIMLVITIFHNIDILHRLVIKL